MLYNASVSNIEPLQRHPLHSIAATLAAAIGDMANLKAKKPIDTIFFAGHLRPVIVYGLSDARAACQAVSEQGGQELAILSPSGVAHSLGPQWLKHLIASSQAIYPDIAITAIMDCGPYEGHVMNAIHHGIQHVYYHGDDQSAEKLGWIAMKTGAIIHREFSEILDLKGEGDQLAACREWFAVDDLKPAGGFATKKA